MVRIRLQRGTAHIEVEGEIAEVERLLAKWWETAPDAAPQANEGHHSTAKKTGSQPRTSEPTKDGDIEFDANELVNRIKAHQDFLRYREKLIVSKASRINRVRFVAWFAAMPLTSGQIQKVLTGLGVKIGLPNVSDTLKRGHADFFNSETRRLGSSPRYSLTESAKHSFETWLASDGG